MHFDLLIRHANVVDGTGQAPFTADVGITGDRIIAIGTLNEANAEDVLDASGLTLTPGFIDVHTHDDINLIRSPDMLPKISQGVTTVIVGNCGISASPVRLEGEVPDPMNLLGRIEDFRYSTFSAYAEAIESVHPSINVAALIGHTSLRSQVMESFDRPANDTEITAMQELLRTALNEGAIGLSSGLAYRNAFHAPQAEMDALVGDVGHVGGIYATHLRDEFAGLPEAMDEAFLTAANGQASLVISHLKCAGVGNWGNASKALTKLDHAALTQTVHCDCYPYTAGSSTLDLGQVTDEIEIFITWSDPHPQMARQSLANIAKQWNISLMEAAKKLQPAGAVYHNMSETDMRQVLVHPLSMVGSDGLPNDPHPHPRLWGTFPRVLGHYSRDMKLLSLPEAVRKMTSLAAANFGLVDRGILQVDAFADLVLFDAEKITDTANFNAPISKACGIELVMVNGHISYRNGEVTAERCGRLLRRKTS